MSTRSDRSTAQYYGNSKMFIVQPRLLFSKTYELEMCPLLPALQKQETFCVGRYSNTNPCVFQNCDSDFLFPKWLNKV